MDKHTVFVSHAHVDNVLCDRYVKALQDRGLDVWYDRNDLQMGYFVSDEIEEQPRKRTALVVLLTQASVASHWVKVETGAFRILASEDDSRIMLPVRIGPCEVPPLMQASKWVDALGRPIDEVMDEVANILGAENNKGARNKQHTAARVFAIANQKGRVGKTTTAINLGACLAEAGRKTLLIDLVAESEMTTGLGVDAHRVGLSTYELIFKDGTTVADVIKPEIRPNLSLLPAKVDLYAAEIELVYLDNREFRLKRVLDAVKSDYDFILIDCPPSLSLLTVNALTASDGVIMPLPCEYFALEGMQQLLRTIRLVHDRLNKYICLFGVVLTMFDPRTTLGKEVVREVSEHFPNERFQTVIPHNVRLAEAPRFGQTILEQDPRSPGALAYKALAKEVIARTASMEPS
jgi:chromosome partitioning protein